MCMNYFIIYLYFCRNRYIKKEIEQEINIYAFPFFISFKSFHLRSKFINIVICHILYEIKFP